ncbi:MAG: tetratricopeptide repeat protein [Spirochaetaceae bacterium]|jgi:tetratricopeptide (TPR) repeat protein|nr:tetratricopeptide repeat protein [Spirochaetaceae bacterium]
MPSLRQLEEFQRSFLNMGGEPAARTALGQAPVEHPLPEREPEGPDPFGALAADAARYEGDEEIFPEGFPFEEAGAALAGDAGDASPDEPALPGDDGTFDFSSFLDTIPDDLPGGDDALPDFAGDAGEAPAEIPPGAEEGGDDFSIPEDLLSGFAEDVEEGRSAGDDAGGEEPGVEGPFEAGDSGDSSDFDFAGFGAGDDAEEAGGPDAGDFGVGDSGVPGPEGFEPDAFEPGDSGGFETPPAGEDDAGGGAGEDPGELPDFSSVDFDLGGAGDLDLSGLDDGGFDLAGESPEPGGVETFPPDSDGDYPDEDYNFSTPEVTEGESGAETAASGENAEPDSFDAFNLEAGAESLAGDLGTTLSSGGGLGESPGGIEDFALSGLDEIIGGSAVRVPVETAGAERARPGRRRARSAEPAESEVKTVEEINLSEEDFARLEETLASYPQNLRIAVEEIIAEQVIAPDLLSSMLNLLVRGGAAKDAAALAGKILGRTIAIPRGFEKKTGAELEAEQATLSYLLVHKFLPFMGIFVVIALSAMSLFYLAYQFIYIPIHAENLYRLGYERIGAGEYERANERFLQAFRTRRVKQWFYRYAEAFRDEGQYLYAEQKYDELLRVYPRDKKGALDYAAMETALLRNYSKAEEILKSNILDYAPDDEAGLTALGDTNLAWGEEEPARYEEARRSYARLLERYGWKDPIVERMLLYFIRTDNLGEVLPLYQYFDQGSRRKISPRTLSELGGYLLDKRLEEPAGVPDANVSRIEGLRNLLLRAVNADPALPESHYHLARYYHSFGAAQEERLTLGRALSAFDSAPEESSRRIAFRIDAERRMAELLTGAREFIPAETHLVKAAGLYEDALSRRRLDRKAEFGRIYANLGDLEYFTKTGDMETALLYYGRAEENGWLPPEMQYRMGSAWYHLGRWENALERFFAISADMPRNRKLLHALGNVSYRRGNYHAAQGYYRRLLEILEAERSRFPVLYPNERPDHLELAERLMAARNNLGAAQEALTLTTGDPSYRAEALGLYAESARAWDALTRDPETMIRSGAGELSSPGINLAFLNSRNMLYPQPGYEPQLYSRIDKDVLEPSAWEELAPQGYRISGLSSRE